MAASIVLSSVIWQTTREHSLTQAFYRLAQYLLNFPALERPPHQRKRASTALSEDNHTALVPLHAIYPVTHCQG